MYLLSKLVAVLLSPLGTALVVGLLALGLTLFRLRRMATVFGAVALCWLWVWSIPFASSWLLERLETESPQMAIPGLPSVDAVVVLGGGISPATSPLDYPSLGPGADRIWHAARIFHAGKKSLLILSGGFTGDSTTSEAEAMRQFLLDLGVPDENLLLEDASMNTSENAVNTAVLLAERNIKEIVLVTSALHMPRARGLFESEGLKVIPAATDYQSSNSGNWLQWVPTPGALEASSRAFKEVVGRLVGR